MTTLQLTPTEARRLAVMAQRLAGPRPPATKSGILEIFRALNCVQIDPIRAVERTQLLVLWSRLGSFDPALLESLQSEDRAIFEAWAHCASLVLTEDYPLFARAMGEGYTGDSVWHGRIREWMAANAALQTHIMERLHAEGPLATGDFEDIAAVPWDSNSGWNTGRNVARMLDFLYGSGHVLAVGRRANQKLWHLADAWLHEWMDHEPWSEEEVVRQSAQRSLQALGIATQPQINNHFIRKRYPTLGKRLVEMVDEGVIVPAAIVDDERGEWPGPWYIHRQTLPLLDAIRNGGWQPRTVLLSPFDNLICDRNRTEQFFDFYYRIEIYVPAAKRQYGYYVLPILHGDRLIGRMDSKMDRKTKTYRIEAIYPEHESDVNAESGAAIADTVRELATFIGAKKIAVSDAVPSAWRAALES